MPRRAPRRSRPLDGLCPARPPWSPITYLLPCHMSEVGIRLVLPLRHRQDRPNVCRIDERVQRQTRWSWCWSLMFRRTNAYKLIVAPRQYVRAQKSLDPEYKGTTGLVARSWAPHDGRPAHKLVAPSILRVELWHDLLSA